MPEDKEPSLYWILFQRYAGLLVFLAIIGLLNLLTIFIDDLTFRSTIFFINESLVLIFTISILFFAGTILRILPFPLNLPRSSSQPRAYSPWYFSSMSSY